jgi:hypothetical protein
MHFTRGSKTAAVQKAAKLDKAFLDQGIRKHPAKDVTGEHEGTCIGIDLEEGMYWAPHKPKLSTLLVGLRQVVDDPVLSPLGMSALLGHVQWFNLLNRSLFSALDSVYTFAREPSPKTARRIPDTARAELMLVLCLAPFWEADLSRPWLPLITATDAAPEYGFGVCVSGCSVDEARRLGRLATKHGDYVRLDRDGDAEDEEERPRVGTPHKLGLTKSSFTTIVSAKALHRAHSGALEATAVVLLLRWLLRSKDKHAHRVVALVDAQAVLGAAAKGRTSAATLKREIRKIAALTLAGDFLMRYVYVPSEDNPADAPSRGVRRRVRKGNLKSARTAGFSARRR